jgi:hypothetical protein
MIALMTRPTRIETYAKCEMPVMKPRNEVPFKPTLIAIALIAIFAILLIPTQVNAYTIIEFGVADRPQQYNNVTFTIEDYRLAKNYKWIEINNEKYAQLPPGVSEAWNDPVVRAAEYEPEFAVPYDGGYFVIINDTLEPGSPVEMCVSYDNNENMTRCEYTAVADEGGYSVLHLQVDVDSPEKMYLVDRSK